MVVYTRISGGSAPSLIIACVALFCACLQTVVAEIDSVFKSRPDLYPPVFTLEHRVPDKLSPGYIFVGPYEASNSGPYIYDDEGNLVWSGWGNSGPGNAHGMHVCKYKGKDHLCFFQGVQQNGYCRGHGVIMDDHYRIVRTVVPGGGMASSDMHEFMPINDGKTALMTVYQQRQFDMSPWNVKSGMGWVMESVFQEVDVETNEVLFEWKSLDHVDPSDGYTWPSHTDTSGTGLDPRSPWDYFHINSVDKNEDGDYLISSRHTCAIYKISGKDGSIIWRLHGARPTFKNINFSFSQQHDARWLSENSTHTLLSLYNNGFNGFNRTHEYSSGMLILIDHRDNTATQLHDYVPPGKNMISSSQGNMQVLENNNVFIGWGNNAYVSEHDEEGNVLLWGYLDKDRIMNYRAQKFEWEGNPTDVPALWTYSQSIDTFSPTTFYVSWNGATRVKFWRFYGATNSTGPFMLVKQVEKRGFETSYSAPYFYQWTYVEAVDVEGKVLGKSRTMFTFIPSVELQSHCGRESCENAPAYGLPGEQGAGPAIPPAGINTVPWIDPGHPEAHFDWGQTGSGSEQGESGSGTLRTAYNNVGWIAPAFGFVVAVVAIYTILRVYRRQHQFSRVKERGSSESLDRAEGSKPWQGSSDQSTESYSVLCTLIHPRRTNAASPMPAPKSGSKGTAGRPSLPSLSLSSSTNNPSSSSAIDTPAATPNPLSATSASFAQSSSKSRNARHTRATSWTSAHDQSGLPSPADFSLSTSQQRRRRESNISLADVSEGSSGRYDDDDDDYSRDNMAVRNTSFDWGPGHARSRSHSYSQPQMSLLQPQELADSSAPRPRPAPVTWMSLPRKGQLALLGLCRVFDFLQIASLQAYMFYQLKSFDENLSDADVSTQAGILQGAFTAAQFATAIPWGRVADAEWGGRKFVLLVGLLGTSLSCLGVAFSTSFAQAVFWRSFGGAINGTVGIIRTMIAENVKEKKYHSRAFLILPIGFNIAALFGPVMGGMLADPVKAYPRLFGPDSSFGGADGVQWLVRYPYALPMLANTIFLSFAAACVAIGLEETLEACKGKPGLGVFSMRILARGIRAVVPSSSPLYHRLPFADYDEEGPLLNRRDIAESYEMEEKATKSTRQSRTLPFRRIWTKNVLCTLLAQAFFDFQMGAFNNLWLLFLSTPRYDANDPASPIQRLPFIFTGGLGMLPQSVGFATAILGVIGMLLQFTIYPSINGRLGTAKSYQYFLTLFPLAYAFAPYIALAPSSAPPPGQANGGWVWFSIIVVLFLQVTARTFTLPTSIILLNNCSPHPSVLGTIHGIGQSVSSAFRTIGPIFSGSWYGYGLEMGMVGFAWWLIALVSVFGCVAAIFVYEGSGHEVFLPGEEEELRD
ncbi:MFS general substrate transporter [Aspergillus sclerotioniger CBS 115572]|uniref:MFS general substrate transporter n=1 Tax=Aspergillus sclerotioniger CBS 115572 TaxID=1450535 RepID=A0A317XAX3_9EURO|nr:MFS general substrate transporter [Aspergillus sclerotioniger CBS 115572]PWY94717.1 MFS general substrate transporter [Aspergillus sclerotioniger CBS 115572]